MTKLDKTTLPLLRAAIGLAAVHFPLHASDGTSVVSSRDIAFLLDGHVDVWSAWSTLESADTDRIVQLLQARRAEYADSEWIRRSLSAALEDDALPGCSLDSDQPEELRIACTPGMPLREFVDEALAIVTRDHRKNSRCLPTAAPGSYYTTVRRRAAGQSSPFVEQHFTIRDYGIAAAHSAPPLVTSAAQQEIKVPVGELRDLAAKLDAAKGTDGFHAQQVDRLFKGLQSRDGLVGLNGLLDLTAGETALLNAPTGVGKSVGLVETLACWMVQQGLVLTALVPSNAEVLKLARAVESHLEVLGLAGTVAPLMSPTSSFERLDGVLHSRPSWDPTACGHSANWGTAAHWPHRPRARQPSITGNLATSPASG
jgi:hypothetical protein